MGFTNVHSSWQNFIQTKNICRSFSWFLVEMSFKELTLWAAKTSRAPRQPIANSRIAIAMIRALVNTRNTIRRFSRASDFDSAFSWRRSRKGARTWWLAAGTIRSADSNFSYAAAARRNIVGPPRRSVRKGSQTLRPLSKSTRTKRQIKRN